MSTIIETATKSVVLDAHVARYIASAVLPAISRDDVTPVLTGARFTREGDGSLRVTSTDRYRVHTVVVKVDGEVPEGLDVIVPKAAIVWLSKNAGTFIRARGPWQPVVGLDFTEGRVRIAVREDKEMTDPDEITYAAATIKGNFPPVFKLIEAARDAEAEPTEANLRLDYLASARAIGDGVRVAHIKFTKGTASKPGPVYIRSGAGEALIQPNASES